MFQRDSKNRGGRRECADPTTGSGQVGGSKTSGSELQSRFEPSAVIEHAWQLMRG